MHKTSIGHKSISVGTGVHHKLMSDVEVFLKRWNFQFWLVWLHTDFWYNDHECNVVSCLTPKASVLAFRTSYPFEMPIQFFLSHYKRTSFRQLLSLYCLLLTPCNGAVTVYTHWSVPVILLTYLEGGMFVRENLRQSVAYIPCKCVCGIVCISNS